MTENRLYKIMSEIRFYANLKYYKYFNPNEVNYYNIINKLYLLENISNSYFRKYPDTDTISLREKIFKENSVARDEFYKCVQESQTNKKQILNDINTLCKNENNKKCKICSEDFQTFYVERNYHIEQNIQLLIKIFKEEIKKV
jgi:hypothetical protein